MKFFLKFSRTILVVFLDALKWPAAIFLGNGGAFF